MLVGEEAVLNYMSLTKCKAFRVYRGSASARSVPVFYYEDAGGVEVCRSQFTQWAKLMSGYTQPIEYLLTVYPKGKPSGREIMDDSEGTPRDTIKMPFYLVSPAGAVMQPGQMPVMPQAMMGSAESPEDMYKRIRKEIESEYELEDLQEQIDEMKDSQSQFQNNLNRILGFAEPILAKFMGTPAAAQTTQIPRATHLAGVEAVNTDVARLNKAIARLRVHDPDITEHLEKLAYVSEVMPETYDQLVTMLNAYQHV